MKGFIKFKVTYYNAASGQTNSINVSARSLESAIAEEHKAIALWKKTQPAIHLVSVVAI